jgi:plasmid stabilization system protein ParE
MRLRLSPEALADLSRLPDFLKLQSPSAAVRARRGIEAALVSLADLPGRGRPTSDPSVRELPVKFGRYGYVIRYQTRQSEVFIVRVLHVRERR